MLLGEQPAARRHRSTRRTCATTSASSTSSGSRSTASRTGAEMLDDFRAVTQRRLDALRALPAGEVGRRGVHARRSRPVPAVHGDPRLRLLVPRPGHPRGARRPGFLEGPVADLSLGRIPPKGLPYVVGKKAGAPQGSTVVFDDHGRAADRRRDRRRGPRCSAPEAAGGPDRHPPLDRRTFARLAGGRWTGDQARRARTWSRRRPRARQPRRRQPGVHDLSRACRHCSATPFWKKKCRPPIGVSMVAPIST